MKDYFVAFAIIFVVVGSIIIQATNIYFSYGDKNYSIK